jgi:NADPH2:quinone reductase
VLEHDEIIVPVRAVALESVDRALARGTHFASHQFLPHLPAVVGSDGVGTLEDGRLIGFGDVRPPYGAMAEIAPIRNLHYVPIPDGVEAATAAAVPSSTLTSLFPPQWGVKLQPGETVLVNGATGFAGKLAIQVAKLLGAGRVVAAGRHEAALRSLPGLGADAVINLKQSDEKVVAAFKQEAGASGYDVVLDYLWGHPTELLLAALVPSALGVARWSVRLVQLGEAAAPRIALRADAVRTSGLEIVGGGGGLTPDAVAKGTSRVWEWIKTGQLHADIEPMPLKDVERAWKRTDLHGARIVLIP